MGEQPVIGLTVWEVLVAIGNLLVLYVILKKLLFTKVKDVIDSREKEVQSIYDTAEATKNEAVKLKKEYEQNIKGAKDKAIEIINDAKENAIKRSGTIIEEASEEARNLKVKAQNAINLERKQVRDELHREIADIATLTASKILEKEINVDDHKKLIDDFISQVGE